MTRRGAFLAGGAAGLLLLLLARSDPAPDLRPSKRPARVPDAAAPPEPAPEIPPSSRPEAPIAALRLCATDPEAYLERIEGDRDAREEALRRIFPRSGNLLLPGERAALLDLLWSMAMAGHYAAADLLGRFELDDAFLRTIAAVVRSTGDPILASRLVRGLRECPSNLKRGGADLADAILLQLRLRDDPELLGGLADVANASGGTLRLEEMRGTFALYLDPRRSEDLRLHAVEGLAAWPETLAAHYPAEDSLRVRMAILHHVSRRRENRETLLHALRSDPEPEARRFAAESVRLAGDRTIVPSLELLAAGEPDPRVARALRETIAVLSRKK